MSYYYHFFAYIGLLLGLYAVTPFTVHFLMFAREMPATGALVWFFGGEIAGSVVGALAALLLALILKLLWRGCVALKNKLD